MSEAGPQADPISRISRPRRASGAGPDPMGTRPTIVAGALIIVAFFGGFGAWATLAPLESAAIALGKVGVDTRRKTVQHLEGGIVGEILVTEGTVVAAGDPLVRLEETQARATRELLEGKRLASLALEARLLAERDGHQRIAFPDPLRARAADPEVAKVIAGQTSIFESRRQALDNQTRILGRQIAQLREEIQGLEGEIAAQTTQLDLIHEETAALETLFEKGFARKPQLLELKREAAEIEGARAQNRSQIARSKQSIAEAELRIQNAHTERHTQVVEELRDVQAELDDLAERIRAADDVLTRTVIAAPVSGTVVDLQVVTRGGVIAPGEPLMDIVPSGDKLVIEAHIQPTDVDVVHPGLTAQVRLTAFNQRTTPVLEGLVERVSADSMVDERSGEPFYLARVALTDGQDGLDELKLYPGMPVEVMVVTGSRTVVEYMLKPIRDSLNRALRED